MSRPFRNRTDFGHVEEYWGHPNGYTSNNYSRPYARPHTRPIPRRSVSRRPRVVNGRNGSIPILSKTELAYFMLVYKTRKCAGTCSNKRSCGGYHNEKERRRPWMDHEYSANPCREVNSSGRRIPIAWKEASCCSKGNLCTDAHTYTEQWYHPTSYKTRTCNSFCSSCKFYIMCYHAHTKAELRSAGEPLHGLESMYNSAKPPEFLSSSWYPSLRPKSPPRLKSHIVLLPPKPKELKSNEAAASSDVVSGVLSSPLLNDPIVETDSDKMDETCDGEIESTVQSGAESTEDHRETKGEPFESRDFECFEGHPEEDLLYNVAMSDEPDEPELTIVEQLEQYNLEQPGSCNSEQPGLCKSEQPGLCISEQPGSYNSEQLGSCKSERPGSCNSEQPGSYNSKQPGSCISEQNNNMCDTEMSVSRSDKENNSTQPETTMIKDSENTAVSPGNISAKINGTQTCDTVESTDEIMTQAPKISLKQSTALQTQLQKSALRIMSRPITPPAQLQLSLSPIAKPKKPLEISKKPKIVDESQLTNGILSFQLAKTKISLSKSPILAKDGTVLFGKEPCTVKPKAATSSEKSKKSTRVKSKRTNLTLYPLPASKPVAKRRKYPKRASKSSKSKGNLRNSNSKKSIPEPRPPPPSTPETTEMEIEKTVESPLSDFSASERKLPDQSNDVICIDDDSVSPEPITKSKRALERVNPSDESNGHGRNVDRTAKKGGKKGVNEGMNCSQVEIKTDPEVSPQRDVNTNESDDIVVDKKDLNAAVRSVSILASFVEENGITFDEELSIEYQGNITRATLMGWAVRWGELKSIRWMLEHGASPDVYTNSHTWQMSMRPIEMCVHIIFAAKIKGQSDGKWNKILRLLVAHKAELNFASNYVDNKGYGLLHMCLRINPLSLPIMLKLVEFGCNIYQRFGPNDQTVLESELMNGAPLKTHGYLEECQERRLRNFKSCLVFALQMKTAHKRTRGKKKRVITRPLVKSVVTRVLDYALPCVNAARRDECCNYVLKKRSDRVKNRCETIKIN
eukprot:831579_1